MSTRRGLNITLDGRVGIVRGWRAADLIKEAGLKPIFAGTVGGWMVDRHRMGDLLAYLEQRNIAVTVVAVADGGVGGTDTPCDDAPSADPMRESGLW